MRHFQNVVDARALEYFRQIRFRPFANSRYVRAIGGLYANDLHCRIFLFEVSRHAHDGTGGAHGRDEVGDFSGSVTPDFRPGRQVVRKRIIRIGELIEYQPATFALYLGCRIARTFHADFLWGQYQLGTEGPHRLAALDTQVFRHHDHHPVAHDRRCHRQCDAGVTARRFDQCIAGLDLAACFGTRDHRHRRSVLDRASGIVAFQFGENDVRCVHAVIRRDAI